MQLKDQREIVSCGKFPISCLKIVPAIGIGGVVAACSAYNRKIVGSSPGSALLIPEVNVVDIQLRALLGLCSLLVHSAKCAGNRM